MSFTAEWTATTGFNTSGYTVTFGKRLNQCSIEEIVAHPMCGSNHPLGNCAYVVKESTFGTGSVAMHLANAQFKDPIPNNMSNTWVCDPAPSDDSALIYRRTIFVGMPASLTAPQYCLTDECDNSILIIEDIKNPNKLVYNYGNINWATGAAATYRTMAIQVKHTCNKGQSTYASAPSTITYVDNTDPDNPVTTTYKICMYHVYTMADECFIVGYDYIGMFGGRYQNASSNYNFLNGGSNYKSFAHENGNCLFIGLNTNSTGGETNLQGIFGEDIYADPVPNPPVFDGTYITYAPTNIVLQNARLRFTMSNSTIGGSMRSSGLNWDLIDTEEIRKQQFARSGVYFVVNGELFKPIISGGMVIGYGTPEQESEIDTYTDLNHPVPSGGGGGGGGGEGDDPWHGVQFGGTGAGGGGAFCSVYYMTPTQLSSLKTWSNTSAPEGFDMLPSIIGLQQLPISVSGVPTTVKFLKSAAITPQGESRVVDTGVSAGGGTGQPIAYNLGSVTIERRMRQRGEPYLDYDCTIELFLPFAGTFVLDTQAVMGRTISAQIVVDPVCGTAFAYAWVENAGEKMPIAYGGGPIAVELPIASNQWGIARAAFVQARGQAIQNVVKAGGEIIAGIIGMKAGAEAAGDRAYLRRRGGRMAVQSAEANAANVLGAQTLSQGATSATGIANSIVSATQLNNTNYTAVNGGFGGSYAEWSQPFQAYVRITRPKFKKPDNFNHTQAVPCVETKKLSSCTGLTYCVNPDLSAVPCTQAEKIMITQALVGGVYAGGGEE